MNRSIRLFSWADVESAIRGDLLRSGWPSWLSEFTAYWDGLQLSIRITTDIEIDAWLLRVFGPRFSNKEGERRIALEAKAGRERWLPIAVEAITDPEPLAKMIALTFEAPTRSVNPDRVHPLALKSTPSIPIIAFHSFKGGVGRTTAAISLALYLTRSDRKNRVLLVDADLEAPGITFMLDERLPDPPVSLADLLALAHGDQDDLQESLGIVADRLCDSVVDGITVLPAFRDLSGYQDLAVRPEHIVRTAMNPFFFADLIRKLAQRCECNVVVMDLRAGISEISAGVLLDPSVRRVMVTTLGGQSLRGTEAVFSKVSRSDSEVSGVIGSDRAASGEISIVFSQVRPADLEALRKAEEQFSTLAQVNIEGEVEVSDNPTAEAGNLSAVVRFLNAPYDANLISLSRSWKDAISRISESPLTDAIKPLALFLENVSSPIGKKPPTSADEARRSLHLMAQKMEHAESGEGEDFLATQPISSLASDHRSELPVIAIAGAKGAGKSFMYLQMLRKGTWDEFLTACSVEGIARDSRIWPLLQPANLGDTALTMVSRARSGSTQKTGLTPRSLAETTDKIRAGLNNCRDESEWRQYWLDLIGFAMGFDFANGFELLLQALRKRQSSIVVTIDGLEDLFQSLWDDEGQKTALRALLQDVVAWVAQVPGRPIGLVIFVRRDMVVASIKQNSAQYLARFRPYELRWSSTEALRLTLWLWRKVVEEEISGIAALSEAELIRSLVPLWGVKLGVATSREAYSHEWVLSVLSDFRGQVQARDVMRLLRVAAQLSIGDARWVDRVLTPAAMRKSPELCGQEKVDEISQESRSLKQIFDRVRRQSHERRIVPFSPRDLELTSEDIELLEKSGIALREDDGYYLPEMIRHGLGFTVPRGARPRVLALARRVRANPS